MFSVMFAFIFRFSCVFSIRFLWYSRKIIRVFDSRFERNIIVLK